MVYKFRLVSRYRHLPLQFKLLLWFVPLLLVTIFAMGWNSYRISSQQVVEKMRQSQDHLTKKTTEQIDEMVKGMVSFSNTMFLDEGVQRLLNASTEAQNDRNSVFKTVTNLMIASNSIQSLILYTLQDQNQAAEPFATNQAGLTTAMKFSDFVHTSYYAEALAAAGSPTFGLTRPSDGIFVGDHYHKIVLSRIIKNVYTLQPAGLAVIGVDAGKIGSQYLDNSKDDVDMFVIDRQGMVITASNRSWIGKQDIELPYFADSDSALTVKERLDQAVGHDQWIVSHLQSEMTGWYVVVVHSKRQLVKELGQISQVTFTIACLCLIMSLMVTWFAAAAITKPLKKLSRSMRRLQTGDFSQRVFFEGNDEIGLLGHGYNLMVQRIKSLINDVYASTLKQREAELKTLQAQIRPHFLYNTLNTICWEAEKKGDKEIADMVYSLSQVFRLSLNDGRDTFTLEQEMELVTNYLFLQKNRFRDRFQFEIFLDDSLKDFIVPKLLLQPLAENAVIHGIEPLSGNGLIAIRAYRNERMIVLEVQDNGVGITPEGLKELRQRLELRKPLVEPENGIRTGFALANVQERLELFFAGTQLEIESIEGMGTRIIIQIAVEGP
ncbi:cache domain-containing sensor histidine kinase [Paenibacillus agri]|uniref:histidine kinase n=1 Tax=Paenibacillus agri TaxID=2744309 RepID=A0A850ELX1_9BACL|nr:sensor histidine kinase [Paenibacillus agri]NUU60374.1 sensor histidine kinase [Paenibacillus agri]